MKNIFYKHNVFYLALMSLFSMYILLFIFIYQNQGCYRYKDMLVFLDIGQGDAIYIENKQGDNILVDTGPPGGKVMQKIKDVKKCSFVKINTLLLTHPDQDHIGESLLIMKKANIKKIIHNGFLTINQNNENNIENELESYIDKNKISLQDITIDNVFDFKNFHIDFLFPIEKTYKDKSKKKVDDNIYSIVFRIVHKNKSFMLTGDASMESEYEIIKNSPDSIKSDVLKLGHHGSKHSTSLSFLEKVDAYEYIVSASKDNKYGHPHEEVLQRVYANKKDSHIRETFSEGNIVYVLD